MCSVCCVRSVCCGVSVVAIVLIKISFPPSCSVAEPAVLDFLEAGGRRIDTALLYHTQIGVGRALSDSGLYRREVFITSKCDSPTYGMVPAGYNETV